VDNPNLKDSINEFSEYICREILATQIDWVSSLEEGVDIEINEQKLRILVRQKG
jgi:isoleucyl-tRNA synthetase